jgi:hypothetical protein
LLIVAQMLSKFPAIFRIQTFVQYWQEHVTATITNSKHCGGG